MADITYRAVRNTREIVYRAVLAPDRPLGDWTVDDFRRFVRDCDAQGIDGAAKVEREGGFAFGGDGGCFMAERKVDVGPEAHTPDVELR